MTAARSGVRYAPFHRVTRGGHSQHFGDQQNARMAPYQVVFPFGYAGRFFIRRGSLEAYFLFPLIFASFKNGLITVQLKKAAALGCVSRFW